MQYIAFLVLGKYYGTQVSQAQLIKWNKTGVLVNQQSSSMQKTTALQMIATLNRLAPFHAAKVIFTQKDYSMHRVESH